MWIYQLLVFLQEPIVSNGNICQFKNLEVKSVFLDEVLMDPERTTLKNVDIKEVKVSCVYLFILKIMTPTMKIDYDDNINNDAVDNDS